MTSFETSSVIRKSIYSLLAVILAVGLTACDLTEGFDEDPNAPGDAPDTKVLNSAEVGAILFQDGNHARLTSMFTEQLNGADRQYAGQDRPQYGVTASDVNNLWITGYADAIGDLEVVKRKARSANNDLLLGISQAVQALTFGTKASLHGDVPYQEAVQGNDNLNPSFDSQLLVYDEAVVSQLDSAITNISNGGVSPGEDDVFFEGSPAPWIEVANTLKARYILHMAHVDEGPASDYSFQDAYDAAEDGISSSNNNLVAPHGLANGVNSNPFWVFRDERGDDMDAGGSYAARLLDEDSDVYRGNAKTDETDRFDDYFFVDDGGTYDMAGNASTNDQPGFFYSQGSDFPIVTYVENELIKAEAALQSGSQTFADALAALNNARSATEQKFGGTYEAYEASDFQSGGIANPGGLTQEEALLKEILEEKYLALISNIEAFADLRRTNNYADVQAGDEVLEFGGSGDAPERFPYAQSEVNGNDNVPDPIPGLFEPVPAFSANYPTP
ncbi:SusD/RagB family nutrient-binding outer membrane lipoprotein [Salinibacter sp.]|uniref:SusD/RagB family nutrient-binding outer membrane lipoprotein n=1 Tax=Salinibacter sp. TaxID=2065818 RepID=UPI0021E743FE|nr:SusD/RagB family nutrient-binding outer membrane lipoprotein [Salinibacter sp.]